MYYYDGERQEVQILEWRSASNFEVQGAWIQRNWITDKGSNHKIDDSKGILSYYMMGKDRKCKSWSAGVQLILRFRGR